MKNRPNVARRLTWRRAFLQEDKMFKKTTLIWQIIFVLFFSLTMPIKAVIQHNRPTILVKISIENRDDLDNITSKGVDIWQVDSMSVTAALRESELDEIIEENFSVEVLIENIYDYSSNFQKPKASLNAAAIARFKTYPEIVQALYDLELSDVAKIYDIGDSLEGRDILAVKISDNTTVEEDEPEVLLVGTHHAREWISAEVPLYIAQRLVEEYETNPQVKKLVDNRQIWIVPVLNPDGFIYTQIDRHWRKNMRADPVTGEVYGVDINRNYDFLWAFDDVGSSPDKDSATYRGEYAFSEPETCAMRDLVESHNFKNIVSYHSWNQWIIYPWGHQANPTPSDMLLTNMADRISLLIESVHGFNYIPVQSNHLGTINGAMGDWAYDGHSIPIITMELRPRGSTQYILSEDQIIPTCEENWPAALYLIGWLKTDFNADGFVNLEDFSILGSNWINSECIAQGWCNGVDINKSGVVNSDDLLGFADNWMEKNITSSFEPFKVWLPRQSTNWFYRKGTSEPPSDWREIDFIMDDTWLEGQTSIGYRDGDDNTELSDMRRNYTTVYLRHTFDIESAQDIPERMILRIYVDDGCVVTINNLQEWRFHVQDGQMYYDSVTETTHNAEWEQIELVNPKQLLHEGRNVIAIHAINRSLLSKGFSIDAELISLPVR